MKFKSLFIVFLYSGILILMIISCKKESNTNASTNPSSTVTDIDGNVYHTVTIGTQVWMVENLKTTKYRNGDPISNDLGMWVSLVTGAYSWFNNDATNYKNPYGALYNWYAVTDSRKIAPSGWHVPSDAEWSILINYLGGESIAGGKLKETGTVHWFTPNVGATNSSGFTGLPVGYRSIFGNFNSYGDLCYWWSSTADSSPYTAWTAHLHFRYNESFRISNNNVSGFSVRCLQD